VDRTFTTATTGTTGDITIGITPGITLGVIITGITPGITLGVILVGIIVDILLADIVLADIVLLRADIVVVVNMQSMEVVGDGGDFWVTHIPAEAASAASCFYQICQPCYRRLAQTVKIIAVTTVRIFFKALSDIVSSGFLCKIAPDFGQELPTNYLQLFCPFLGQFSGIVQ
jgi:hypothetical protein